MIGVLREPELGGHVGGQLTIMIMIAVSAAYGALGGLVFGIIINFLVNPKFRVPIGVLIGSCCGFIYMKDVAHSLFVVLLASLLGMVLAYKRVQSSAP